MAQPDTSIYNMLGRGVKSVADYDNERSQGEMNQLNLLSAREDMAGKQRATRNALALEDAYKGFGADPTQNANLLYQRGQGGAAQGYLKSVAELEAERAKTAGARATASKTTADTQAQQFESYRKVLGTIQSPQEAEAWVTASYNDDIVGPTLQKLGPLEDGLARLRQAAATPEGFRQWQAQAALGIEKVAEMAQKEKDYGLRSANEFMTPDGRGGFVPNQPLINAKRSVAKAGASSVSVNTGQKGYENESKLRNDFKSEPIYKDFQDMKSAHAQIQAGIAQGTPISDTAVATKIMKLLDPGSVVRESELAIAMAAAGKMDRMQNYVQMQISGEKLTPQQRKDFGALADELMGAATQAYNAKRGEYEQFGKTYNLNPAVLGEPAPSGAKSPGKLTTAEQAELDSLRARFKGR